MIGVEGSGAGNVPPAQPARRLRVLEVAARFLPDLGGIETHINEVSRRLALDFDITVLATDRSGKLPHEERTAGFHVIRTRAYPSSRDYYLAPSVYGLVRRSNADVVHCQGIHTPVPVQAMLASRRAGIPYVVTFHTGGHSVDWRRRIRSRQWQALGPLLRGAAALIAVSTFERDMFADLCGIEPAKFAIIRNGGGLPPLDHVVPVERGRIVSSGRLEKYKGHQRVIAAMPEVLREVPEATLHILGSGPYESELRTLINRLGLNQTVSIEHIPTQERSRMAEVLAGASVFAALSDYEAHPVAVMEALALGVPVVGLDTAGIGDLVTEQLVRGVQPGSSPTEVANALVDVIRAERRTTIGQLPTWEQAAASVGAIYERVGSSSTTFGDRKRPTK